MERYREVLGFTVEFTYGKAALYAGVERDALLIHLQAAEHTNRQPGQGSGYAFADEVDGLFKELRSKGEYVLQASKDYPYGMRDFDIVDPDGNQLSFGMGTGMIYTLELPGLDNRQNL